MKSSRPSLRETRDKWPLGKGPDKNCCHRHIMNMITPWLVEPGGLPIKILKVLQPSSILATRPAHPNLLDLITLTILGERYKL